MSIPTTRREMAVDQLCVWLLSILPSLLHSQYSNSKCLITAPDLFQRDDNDRTAPALYQFFKQMFRFYFDRSHKGNDWDAVKARLSAEISSGKKTEGAATKEMLSLLKDKYTRHSMHFSDGVGRMGARVLHADTSGGSSAICSCTVAWRVGVGAVQPDLHWAFGVPLLCIGPTVDFMLFSSLNFVQQKSKEVLQTHAKF